MPSCMLLSLSSFAWCQIACNLARAGPFCSMIAVLTARSHLHKFLDFVQSSIDCWVMKLMCGTPCLGTSEGGLPFSTMLLVLLSLIWSSCRRRSWRGRCSSHGGCGTFHNLIACGCFFHPTRDPRGIVLVCSLLQLGAGCVAVFSRTCSFPNIVLNARKAWVVESDVRLICVVWPLNASLVSRPGRTS